MQLEDETELSELELEENQFDLELEQSGLLVAHKKTTLKNYSFILNVFVSFMVVHFL